jgi:hypothetical protein
VPILVTAPTPDATTVTLAADVRKQLLMTSVSKTRKAIYRAWLTAHPTY